jgi:hypothetical protein
MSAAHAPSGEAFSLMKLGEWNVRLQERATSALQSGDGLVRCPLKTLGHVTEGFGLTAWIQLCKAGAVDVDE